MANFIALVDPDVERRHRFLREAGPQLAIVDGLAEGRLENGRFSAVWAAAPDAPIDVASHGDRSSLLFGDAFNGDLRLDAESLLRRTATSDALAYDGFHAAIASDGRGELVALGDRLGLFPIFYATSTDGTVLVVGSSPELFRVHPLFPARPSVRGLVGLLLAHGIVGGRTLLEGVRRLSVGHALFYSCNRDAREVEQSGIETSADVDTLDFSGHVERLDSVWRATLARHVPADRPVGLLLSGGRDSRLIAGYLADLEREVRTLSLGRASDYDAGSAATVAQTLGFEHRRIDIPEARLPEWASLQARWEHLSAGFSNVHTWAAIPAMRILASRCASGYLREIREVPLGSGGFDGWIEGPHGHGIRPDLLRAMLRPVYAGVVDDVVEELRGLWNASSPHPGDRAWRFLLRHGWRAHPGGVLWRFSLGSWPILPLLDRRLLDLLASLPDSTLADRRAQDALLRRHFFSLTRLPLDRNGHDTMPLEPSLPRRVINPALLRLRSVRSRLGGGDADRRYYRRVYDIESDGWLAVRERAEPGREALGRLFDLTALNGVLPPPPAPLRLEHPIRDGFVPKLFLGLMLWALDHPV